VYAHVLEHRAMNEAAHATSMDLTGKLTAELVTDTLADAGRTVDVDPECDHDHVAGTSEPPGSTLRCH
jgi:3-oxoacyl-[acyl-carrier-protein] synthase II